VQAAKDGNMAEVNRLVVAEDDIGVKTEALAVAVRQQRVDVAQAILNSGLAKAENNNGFTALMYAAGHGHLGAAQMLLDHGADIDKQELATRQIVRESSENGTNVREVEPGPREAVGNCALSLAILGKHADIVRLLVGRGARTNLRVIYREAAVIPVSSHNGTYQYSDFVSITQGEATILELAEMSADPAIIAAVKPASGN